MRGFGVGAAAVVLLLAGLLTTACTNTGRAVLSDGTEVKFTESEPKVLIPNRAVPPVGKTAGQLVYVPECTCFVFLTLGPPDHSYAVWPAGTEGVNTPTPSVRLPDGRTFAAGTFLEISAARLGFQGGDTPFDLPRGQVDFFSRHEALVITTAEEIPGPDDDR